MSAARLVIETKTFRLLRERLDEAVSSGVNALVSGPPSSEKSYALQNLCAQFNAAGKPVIYCYVGVDCTEAHLYLSIAEAAAIPVRSSLRWGCRYAVLNNLRSRAKLPAIVLDEAQHLTLSALEGVRQIHDVTRRDERQGCGIVLAGSHGLLQYFLHPQRRFRLEQLLSRIPHRVQLEGMTAKEVLTLAARAFGNGKPAQLQEKHQKKLLEVCTVTDPYFIGPDGKAAPRTYYSSRRLLEYIRQQKTGLRLATEHV